MGREDRARRSAVYRQRDRARVGLVCVCVLLGLVATAVSAELGSAKLPDRWPSGTVTYFNAAPEHAWAVQQAVNAWNGSGAHVRFVASTAAAAQLVIRSGKETCGEGRATLGYTPEAVTFLFRPGSGYGCDRFSAARVLAHELGHVLGLEHIKGACAVMNATGDYRGSRRCAPSEPWEWRCRLVERSDALAAAKVYGGTPAPAHGPATCPLYPSLQAAPTRIRLVRARSKAGELVVSFVRPADPDTPRFLGGKGEPSFTLSYVRGRCADKPRKAWNRWSVAPGEVQLVSERVRESGMHCLRVWAADRLGRPSEAPATLEVDVR